MATENLVPDGDVTTDWDGTTAGDYHSAIDEGDPASPDSDYVYENTPANQHCRFDMSAPSFVGTCTAIRIGYNVESGDESQDDILRTRIYDGASEIGSYKDITLNYTQEERWTAQWTGLSLSESDLSDFRVDFEAVGDAPFKVYTMIAEITYTPSTGLKINIADTFEDVESLQINIGDDWKDVVEVKINIGDDWKDVF